MVNSYIFTFHYVSIKSKKLQKWKRWLTVFTFHYVSIKSPNHDPDGWGLIQFTFHYVSIKSDDEWINYVFEPYLHSTMFLLNLTAVQGQISSKVIYIPLCFY